MQEELSERLLKHYNSVTQTPALVVHLTLRGSHIKKAINRGFRNKLQQHSAGFTKTVRSTSSLKQPYLKIDFF
jgi:hypothetical protein